MTGGFDPFLDHGFGIWECFLPGGTVGGASCQLGRLGNEGVVLVATSDRE